MTEKDLEIQNLRRENEWLKKRIELAERTLAEAEKKLPRWIKTADKLPEPQTYVFPTLHDVHPVDMWAEIPTPEEG